MWGVQRTDSIESYTIPRGGRVERSSMAEPCSFPTFKGLEDEKKQAKEQPRSKRRARKAQCPREQGFKRKGVVITPMPQRDWA